MYIQKIDEKIPKSSFKLKIKFDIQSDNRLRLLKMLNLLKIRILNKSKCTKANILQKINILINFNKMKAFNKRLSWIQQINLILICYHMLKRLQPHKNEVVTVYINLLPKGRR